MYFETDAEHQNATLYRNCKEYMNSYSIVIFYFTWCCYIKAVLEITAEISFIFFAKMTYILLIFR